METFENLMAKGLGSITVGQVLQAILLLVVVLVVVKIVMSIVKRMFERSKADNTLKVFLLSVIRVALYAVGIVIVADSLGIPVTSLVAVLSVAGLAVSLAAQNILSNVFGGVTLLLTRPFHAGDFVELNGLSGTVQDVGLSYTHLCTPDNKLIIIPNSEVAAAKITNYSSEPNRRVDVEVTASYDAPTEKVKAALMEAVSKVDGVLEDPAPVAILVNYEESSIRYAVRVWAPNAKFWDVRFALLENIRTSFASHNVEMTYNHLNVHIMEQSKD